MGKFTGAPLGIKLISRNSIKLRGLLIFFQHFEFLNASYSECLLFKIFPRIWSCIYISKCSLKNSDNMEKRGNVAILSFDRLR